MSDHRPAQSQASDSSRQAAIRTPDQLQQSRRPDAPATGGAAERPREAGQAGQVGQAGEAAPRRDGILGQLETERAHD